MPTKQIQRSKSAIKLDDVDNHIHLDQGPSLTAQSVEETIVQPSEIAPFLDAAVDIGGGEEGIDLLDIYRSNRKLGSATLRVNFLPAAAVSRLMPGHSDPALIWPFENADGERVAAQIAVLAGRSQPEWDQNKGDVGEMRNVGAFEGAVHIIGEPGDAIVLGIGVVEVEVAAQVAGLTGGIAAGTIDNLAALPTLRPDLFEGATEVVIAIAGYGERLQRGDADAAKRARVQLRAARAAAEALAADGISVRIVPDDMRWWTSVPPAGRHLDELRAAVKATPVYVTEADRRRARLDELAPDWEAECPPGPLPHLVAPFLPEAGSVIIAGAYGAGKTSFAIGLGKAIAAGRPFLNFTPTRPARVLYLDYELGSSRIGYRLRREPTSEGFKENFRSLTRHQLQPLNTTDGRANIEEMCLLHNAEVIIVDSISKAWKFKTLADEEDILSDFDDWIMAQTDEGRAVILIHQTNNEGKMAGFASKAQVVDTTMFLTKFEDQSGAMRAAFMRDLAKTPDPARDAAMAGGVALIRLEYGKTREFHPDAAPPIVAGFSLKGIETGGRAYWHYRPAPEATGEPTRASTAKAAKAANAEQRPDLAERNAEMLRLREEGLNGKQIAAKLGVSEAMVSRALPRRAL